MGLDEAPVTGRPLVSVVMCTYNGRAFIENAVADIVGQTLGDWELVISDDGSTDGTREWLRGLGGDPRIRLFLQERNLGYVRNKNFAFGQARGRFLTQQDQDDRSHPERLARQVEALRRTGLEIAACGYRRIGHGGETIRTVGPDRECVVREPGRDGYPFWFPSLMASRQVHDEIGPFSEYFSGAFGDDFYWTAVANQRFPIVCLPEPLYSYVDAPASITSLLDNRRKLVISEVLRTLLDQRRETGTDWLEQGDMAALDTLERRLLTDKRFMAGQYQIYAVRSIDQNRLAPAARLLWTAFRLAPLRPALARSLVYFLRRAWVARTRPCN